MINETNSPELIEVIEQTLSTTNSNFILDELCSKYLDKDSLYIWGGAIRDPIINLIHGLSLTPTDIDLIVDDSGCPLDFSALKKQLPNSTINRFGSVKWVTPNGTQVDITKFSNISNCRSPSLESTLNLCDFNVSAIAFSPSKKLIYDIEALDGINRGEIDILPETGEELAILLARLIFHSERFGFELGSRGTDLISSQYTDQLDPQIIKYLNYKSKSQSISYILNELIVLSE